jgi:hypothetical protein
MSVVDQSFRTITCNGAGCEKTTTFNQTDSKLAEEQNPWLKNCRMVQVPGRAAFVYCSDSCEVSGVTTGQHNPVDAKPSIVPGNTASIQAAAAAAALSEQATKSIKAGPVIQR